jgi:hypothetical protein
MDIWTLRTFVTRAPHQTGIAGTVILLAGAAWFVMGPASAAGAASPSADAEAKGAQTLYMCDFEQAPLDKAPDDFLVLDGAFAVKTEGGNRFLELPEAPVDSFGALFGPSASNLVCVVGRIYGTNRGRRLPVFGLGLNGAGGLKLMVAPGKDALEIFRGDECLARAPYKWTSGAWTSLRLQLRTAGEGTWQAQGKAWKEGSPEPETWLVTHQDKTELPPGKASLWGSPLSGTPIRFDDLRVLSIGK